MKVIIIYDNTSTKSDLQADWGFSALVEIEGRRILFDTGADGDILLSNIEKLKTNPQDIEDIFYFPSSLGPYRWPIIFSSLE